MNKAKRSILNCLRWPTRLALPARSSRDFAAIMVIVVLAFVLGGGSRPDIASLPYLRTAAAFGIAYALVGLADIPLRPFKGLLALASCCVILPALHYLPLPPGFSNSLSGHHIISEIDRHLGWSDVWRPLSMSPDWTLNAILAITVPLAALLLAIRLAPRDHLRLGIALCVLGGLSAILAMLQIQGPANGPLYFYEVTNNGAAVGLFANRNHQSVFLASLMPIAFALISTQHRRRQTRLFRRQPSLNPVFDRLKRQHWGPVLAIAVTVFFILPMVIITGSRSGLLAFCIALAGLPCVVDLRGSEVDGAKASSITLGLLLVLVPLLIGLAIWLDRAEAIDRLIASTPQDEMRYKMLPVMREIILTYWPWGSGIGSFQKVYQVFEPTYLLAPTYMNHAHNDWLEVLMTGGAPALLLLLGACAGWAWSAYRIIQAGSCDAFQPYRRAALIVVVILAVASLSDYPLRTPALAVLLMISAVWLCVPFGTGADWAISPAKRSVKQNEKVP